MQFSCTCRAGLSMTEPCNCFYAMFGILQAITSSGKNLLIADSVQIREATAKLKLLSINFNTAES